MQFMLKNFLIVFTLMELTACGGGGHSSQPPNSSNSSAVSSNPPSIIEASIWTGTGDSLISFTPSIAGLEFTRRENEGCTSCATKTDKVTAGTPITDTTLTLNKPAYYELKAPGFASTAAVTSANISGSNQGFTTFNNKLWLAAKGTPSRLWQTVDGLNWQEKALPVLPPENSDNSQITKNIGDNKLITFNQKLWLFAAIDNDVRTWLGFYYQNITYTTDIKVWNSDDGLSWQEQTGNLPKLKSCCYSLQVYNNKLWLLNSNGQLTQLWSSANGKDWAQEALPDTDLQSSYVSLGQFKQQLWIASNKEDSFTIDFRLVTLKAGKYDFWSSSNGQDWKSQNVNTDQVFRKNFQLTDTGTHLIIAGGTCFFANDRFRPQDGIDKERPCYYTGEISTDLQWWPERAAFLFSTPVINPAKLNQTWWAVFLNATYLTVLNSTDAFSWEALSPPGKAYERKGGLFTNLKGTFWSFRYPYKQSSTDGLHWQTYEQIDSNKPSELLGGVTPPYEFNNKLWLPTYAISWLGKSGEPSHMWTSDDGINWTAQAAPVELEISETSHPKVVVSPDKLFWLTSDKLLTSSDGIQWVSVPNAPSGTKIGAAWFNNQLLVAVPDSTFYLLNQHLPHANPYEQPAIKILASPNALDWTESATNIGIAAEGALFYKFNNRLWLIGRCASEERRCAYASDENNHWSSITVPPPFVDLAYLDIQPVEYNKLLWFFRDNETWQSSDGIQWRKGQLLEFHTQ